MKRYHQEKHIMQRRKKQALIAYNHSATVGKYRKTHIGCNKAGCQLCHPEKYPKRIPTRKEKLHEHEREHYGA